MNLQYKGSNKWGKTEWVDADYYDESRPFEGFELEEWKIPRYRELIEVSESSIGRKLTKAEAGTMAWLSGFEKSTCNHVAELIRGAFENGRKIDKLKGETGHEENRTKEDL